MSGQNGVTVYPRTSYPDSREVSVTGWSDERLGRIFGEPNQIAIDSLDKVPKTQKYLGFEAWQGQQEYMTTIYHTHFEQMDGWEPILATFRPRTQKIHKYYIYKADLTMMQPSNVGHAPEYVQFTAQQQTKVMRRFALGLKMDYERVQDGPEQDVRDEWTLKNAMIVSAAIVTAKMLIEDAVATAHDFWTKYYKDSGPRYGTLSEAVRREIRYFGIFNKESQSPYIISNEARQITRTSGVVPDHAVIGFGDSHFLAYASKDDREARKVGTTLANANMIKGGEALEYRFNDIRLMEATRREFDEGQEPLEFLQMDSQVGRCALIDWTKHVNVEKWTPHLQSIQWIDGPQDDWKTIGVKEAIDNCQRFDANGKLLVDDLNDVVKNYESIRSESGMSPKQLDASNRPYLDPYLRWENGKYVTVTTWGDQDEHYNPTAKLLAWARIVDNAEVDITIIGDSKPANFPSALFVPDAGVIATLATNTGLSGALMNTTLVYLSSRYQDDFNNLDANAAKDALNTLLTDTDLAVQRRASKCLDTMNVFLAQKNAAGADLFYRQLRECVDVGTTDTLTATAIARITADAQSNVVTSTNAATRLQAVKDTGASDKIHNIVAALFGAEIDAHILKKWVNAGIPVPTNYLLINPHITIHTGGILFFEAGGDTAELAYNFQHNTMSFSSERREFSSHATSYMSAVVIDTRRVLSFRRTFMKSLVGGLGNRWWKNPAGYMDDPRAFDGFVADVGGNWTAEDFEPVMSLTKIDLSDFTVNIDVPDHELGMTTYPSQFYYTNLFKFHMVNYGASNDYTTHHHYNTRMNMVFLPCGYRESRSQANGGGYHRHRPDKTHLGPYQFPGIVEYYNGKLGVIDQDPRIHR